MPVEAGVVVVQVGIVAVEHAVVFDPAFLVEYEDFARGVQYRNLVVVEVRFQQRLQSLQRRHVLVVEQLGQFARVALALAFLAEVVERPVVDQRTFGQREGMAVVSAVVASRGYPKMDQGAVRVEVMC